MRRALPGLVCLLLSACGCLIAFTETQWIDLVHLRDGNMLKGVIVEQTAGESVRLATSEQIVLTLAQREIDSMEKVEAKETFPLAFKDVLILKDGVIFRGLLVEQRPEEEVVLRTENGLHLAFDMEEIWKILKEKRLIGQPQEAAPAEDSLRTMKLVLRIELGAKAIRKERSAERPASPQEQVEGLKEELGELEREQDEAEQELAAELRGSEREQIEQSCRQIEELLQELEQGMEACGEPQAAFGVLSQAVAMNVSQASLGPTAQRLQEGIAELKGRIAVKIPSEEEIRALEEAQRSRAMLGKWLADGNWRKPFYKSKARVLAKNLPTEDRQFLYDAYSKHTGWLGFGLNAIPALQLGSWAQGDGLGALFGYAHAVGALVTGFYPPRWLAPENTSLFEAQPYLLVGLWSASYILSLIQPLYYQAHWNRRLADVLQLPEGAARRKTRQAVLLPPAVAVQRTPNEGLQVHIRVVSLAY